MIYIVYASLLKLLAKKSPFTFFKSILPVQLLAFSTSSSSATLPLTMEHCEKELKISPDVASFVLPVGATVNMDGTSLYQAVAAVFIAQALGMNLGFSEQLSIVLTATLASIGSAGVPGAGMVMLVIVLNSIGVPTEGIALIFAVDRILDMFRTVVNVTGDMVVATIIDDFESKRNQNSI
jgi:Na+/H+-dicarboxylate symporter